MTTCRSAAWKAKVVTSAWWVKHDQVGSDLETHSQHNNDTD